MAYAFKKRLANRANYGPKRAIAKIKYIVVHYTANDGDTDEGNSNHFANHIVSASAHYFVDGDSVTQSVPDDYIAWSVGGSKWSDCNKTGGGKLYGQCTNTNSLNVELCDEVKNGKSDFSTATIENAVELIKEKMKLYNIDINHVIRHFDVTGKPCPKPFVNNTEWLKFKQKLTESEDLTMAQYEELKNEISTLKNTILDIKTNVENIEKSKDKIYNRIQDIPQWGLPTIQKLIAKGLYNGAGENDLFLPESLLRTLVINDRAGLYD